MKSRFVSEIFDEPKRWGLRGDPFLWRYLKARYSDVKIPYPPESLEKDILRAFADFAGEFPNSEKIYFVAEFAKTHVGMSTGMLSGDFWLNTAIPLLLERLEKANSC